VYGAASTHVWVSIVLRITAVPLSHIALKRVND
jgi:hypothetical protein